MHGIYALDDTGRGFLERAGKVARETALPHADEVDRQARFPREGIDALGREGLLGLTVPEEFGGGGQPPGTFSAVAEELARACGSTAMVYVMHVAGTQAVVASRTLSRREPLLEKIAAGNHLTTLAFSERGSRSQFWAPVSRLDELDGNGRYVTNASKSWVTSASRADSYVCTARKPQADSPLESTLYLLARESPGVKISGGFDGLGLRGNDSSPVALQDVEIRAEDLLTPPGEGAAAMLEVVLPWFSVGTAAMANGLSLAAVSATRDHLSGAGFEDEGSKLRDLPNLRARLAQMSVRTEQSRALLGFATRKLEHPDEQTPLDVLRARMSAIEAAVDVTDLAMKSCGGAAFSKHLGIQRFFRDARAGWVMAPTLDHLKEFLGRSLTGLPLF